MVSKQFLKLLANRQQQATGSTLPAAMATIADSFGYSSFEELMQADEKHKLNTEERADLFRDLAPYIDLAFEHNARRTAQPADWQESVEQILDAIMRFLFGYTQEECRELQADEELTQLLVRVHAANDVREQKLLSLIDQGFTTARPAGGLSAQ